MNQLLFFQCWESDRGLLVRCKTGVQLRDCRKLGHAVHIYINRRDKTCVFDIRLDIWLPRERDAIRSRFLVLGGMDCKAVNYKIQLVWYSVQDLKKKHSTAHSIWLIIRQTHCLHCVYWQTQMNMHTHAERERKRGGGELSLVLIQPPMLGCLCSC